MARISKRRKLFAEQVEEGKVYNFADALAVLKEVSKKSKTKLEESVDLALNLGIDPKKGEQTVRSMFSLPVSSGKDVKVAVFAEGDQAKEAKKKGATAVGMDDLAASMKKGELDYDVVIAVPEAMKIVGQIGRILGPKGLMPNPKEGTVTPNVGKALDAAKAGQVRLRNDDGGIIHCPLGKLAMKPADLEKNFVAAVNEVRRLKPNTSKGTYLNKITVSSTMGPGIPVNLPAG